MVDVGGLLRCGMFGDNFVLFVMKNNWVGVVMYGCIRDFEEILRMDVGVKVLGIMSLKFIKKGLGERDIVVRFGGVIFIFGYYFYVDFDGIIVLFKELIFD